MTQLTILNYNEVCEIANRYGIDEVISFSVLSGGSENTNYLLAGRENQYVLTICEQKSEAETRQLASLLEHLEDYGFRTSKIIKNKTNNASVELYKGKPFMLKSFLEGTILNQLPLKLLELLGVELGKLHKVPPPNYLQESIGYGIEYFDTISEYAEGSEFQNWLIEQKAYLLPFFNSNLPKALIHSDVFSSNVIVNNDRNSVCIMDFEEATHYYRIFDLGMAIVGVCREHGLINLKNARALLKGYAREIQLQDNEIKTLKPFTVYAASAMAFWRHKNFNFVNPMPKLSTHYLELKKLADAIKELPENCFSTL